MAGPQELLERELRGRADRQRGDAGTQGGGMHQRPTSGGAQCHRRQQRITGAGRWLFPNNRRPNDVMAATTVNRGTSRMTIAIASRNSLRSSQTSTVRSSASNAPQLSASLKNGMTTEISIGRAGAWNSDIRLVPAFA